MCGCFVKGLLFELPNVGWVIVASGQGNKVHPALGGTRLERFIWKGISSVAHAELCEQTVNKVEGLGGFVRIEMDGTLLVRVGVAFGTSVLTGKALLVLLHAHIPRYHKIQINHLTTEFLVGRVQLFQHESFAVDAKRFHTDQQLYWRSA